MIGTSELFLLQKHAHLLHPLLILTDIKVLLNDSNKHIQHDEVCQDVPEDEESGTNPGCVPTVIEASHVIEYRRPVLG